MSTYADLVKMARQVIHRLERLSVDSHWAHRASGLRRSLVRCTDELEQGGADAEQTARRPDGADAEQTARRPDGADAEQTARRLEELLRQGFDILENAAREMGDHH